MLYSSRMNHSESKVSEKFQITWKKGDIFCYGKIRIASNLPL